jgi:putative photosynthetic complex assembly protein 2
MQSLVVHAVLFTVFVWWFTTGAIIFLDGMPRRTIPLIMLAATVGALACIHGLAVTSTDTSVSGAYWAFTFGLLAWGWNEMGFLMGLITGPRQTPCPANATGGQRLVYAIQAVAFHELAIAATAVLVAVATADGANQTGFWTFMVLWVMRLSAKINVFLGVPNITEEFLPPHIQYLKSYFRKRAMNWMFPLSITGCTLLTVFLGVRAVASGATAFETTAFTLLATLSALALIEHWFMVLPIPSERLWTWSLASHTKTATANALVVPVPVIVPATPSTVAAFEAATGLAESHTQASIEATIVPFPTLTPATHRRRQ